MPGQSPRDFAEWMQKIERQSKAALRNSSYAVQSAREKALEVIEQVLPGTPAAPVEISLQTSIYQDQSGAWRGRLDVDFPDVTLTVDQKPVTVTGYELYGYETALYEGGAEPVWEQYGGSDTSSITRMDLPPGTEYVMKVRAVGGVWSSEFPVFIGHDTTPPPQPTKPTAEVFLGAITVKWDKKAVTGDMPADFEGAILCVGTEPSPGLDKAVTRFDMHEATFVITGAAYYTPVYIRLVAVDTTGNFSPWSEQEVAITKPLVDADIILGEIDAGKTRIINAGKVMLETGKELSEKLQEADTAIDSTRKALEGPGGLTERLTTAEGRLRDVGSLTLEAGTTLREKLAASDLAIKNTSTGLATLRDTTLPALSTSLDDANTRLDAADKLLTDTFPKRLTAVEGTASNAATRATAAETAAAKAAADLVTAKQRADAAAVDAAQAARDADAAEAASERATGAAGEAEAAADKAAKDALAALTAAQNAGGDVDAAQRAAAAAQTAADAAKAQATSAGTAAAAADAKAAQAAADAAKAAADALLAQQQATKSAGEATAAKGEAATAATKAAAAEAAAATAKTRADTAATNATTAATKAAAAEASATKATGSAGVAETAADKAAKDAAAALTQAQNSGSNATAAQRAADAAKTASDTAAAKATAAGTAAAAADAAAAKAAADAAQAAADLIVARNAAADARGDADTALARADAAITAAGSAARVLYSTADPSGTAREGDTWRKTNGAAGDVIAEWRYTKVGNAAASWKPQKVTSDMVSNLDIGKLTAGTAAIVTLVAERIAGATAEFQRVDAKNIFVTGTASFNEVVAKRIAADTGQYLTLGVEQLTVTGNANLKEAVANKLFANIFTANKISTQHMLIGNFSNLLENGNFEYGQQGWGDGATKSYWTFEPTGGKQAPGVVKFTGTTTRSFGPTSNIPIPVDPLDTYRLNGWMRTTSEGPVQGEICWYWYRADGSFLGNHNLFFRNMTAADGWVPVTGQKAPPAEAAFLRVRVVGTLAQTTDELYFDDIGVALATDASLLVDGSVTAKTITASEEMGAKLAKFIKLEVTDLVSTGSAKINEAVITKLFTETFATNKLTAGQVLIGMPGNVLPDIGHNEPLMVAARNASSTMTVTLSSSNDLALAHTSGTSYFRPYGVPQDTVSYKNWIPVKPGQVWRWGLKVISLKGGGSIKFVGRTLDGQAYANPAAQTTLATGTGSYTVEAEIPEGCAWIIPEMSLLTATGSSWVARGSMFMHQVIDNALVVDGAITTKKLTVTADMTAALLRAKKVEAIEIDVNSLKADTAWIGALRTGILVTDVVTSTHIKSDSITADLLKADAITAKHTLTGALVRSAASGARTEMNNQGLRVLNASNVELVRLGYGIGTGMSIRNPVNGVMAPLSNMVFSAEYFTSTVPIDYAAGSTRVYAPSMVGYGFRYVLRSDSQAYEYTAVSESAILMWEASVEIWNQNERFPVEEIDFVPFELGMNIFNITGAGLPGSLVDIGNFGRYVTGWTHTKIGPPGPAGSAESSVQGHGLATGLTPGSRYKVPLYLKAPTFQSGGSQMGALNAQVRNIRLVIIPR